MRLQEIQTRKNEIKELLLGNTEVNLEEIEAELSALEVEERSIQQRKETADKIATGEVRGNKISEEKELNNEMNNTNTVEYRKAFMHYVTNGTPIPQELRADANTTLSEVGSVIPEVVLEKIIEKIEAVGMILPLVTKTAYKAGVSIPTSAVKPVATWVSEGSGSDRQEKTTGAVTFANYKLRCAVSVSLEVDTLALPAFEAALIKNVADAMVKSLEQAIISGNGTGKCKGILAETPETGQAIDAVPGFAALVAAEAALPMEYEANAVYVMTKKSFMQFIGELGEDGQPIARTNYGIAGRPERTLLGRPVVLCNYVDTYAVGLADETVWAFLFDFSDYVLNTSYQMVLKKYEDNDTDDFVTKAIMLADGKVVDKNSLVTLKK